MSDLDTTPDPAALVDTTYAAKYVGTTGVALIKLRARRGGPRYVRPTGNRTGPVRYRIADLDRWIDSNTIDPAEALDATPRTRRRTTTAELAERAEAARAKRAEDATTTDPGETP